MSGGPDTQPGSDERIIVRRPFELIIDSGRDDEPEPRRFASLDAALAAYERLPAEFARFAWIREWATTTAPAPIVVHMRDGVRVDGGRGR